MILRRPETSWSAVVQGAVLCGVEKTTIPSSPTHGLTIVTSFEKSYGFPMDILASEIDNTLEDTTVGVDGHIYAEKLMVWLFDKDDAIFGNKPMTASRSIPFFAEGSISGSGEVDIYSCTEDQGNRPTNFQTALDGKSKYFDSY